MAIHKKYPALGRGLDALISPNREIQTDGSSSINEIELDRIVANPNQPRKDFNETSLRELADSIAEIGVIQPITVRELEDNRYEIIAGERRCKASALAGKTTIPAYIRTANDENMMEMALIENIQREDLNAVEIALAYQHLLETYGMTQERLSERIGKNRSTITNYLRLLRLPALIQVALQNKTIDMGHARALLALDSSADQIEVFKQIEAQNLSVRKVEELVRKILDGKKTPDTNERPVSKKTLPEEFHILKDSLCQFFQTKVEMTCSDKGKGKISIPFSSEEELERIIELFDRLKN